MARLNKQVLGKLKGSIGDIVFRQRNGTNYVATKPGSFNTPEDPASVDRRERFKLAVRLSSNINSVPYLNSIWSRKTGGSSPFNFITKTNYKYMEPEGPTDLAVLVPEFGFGITVNSAGITPPQVQVVIDPIGNTAGIDPTVETTIRMVSIIYLSSPVDEFTEPYTFVTMASAGVPTDLENPLTFDIPYSNQEIQIYDAYEDALAFFALVTLDDSENPVHYSSTFIE